MQSCLEPQEQHCIGFLLVQCCLELLGQHRTGVIICAILPQVYLLGQHCTINTLCSVALEATENIAKEKILLNVALILLGQPLHR